jgi:hypothetical protein
MGFFLFTKASRPAVGPTQSPTQWVPGLETDHSPPSNTDVKIRGGGGGWGIYTRVYPKVSGLAAWSEN